MERFGEPGRRVLLEVFRSRHDPRAVSGAQVYDGLSSVGGARYCGDVKPADHGQPSHELVYR